MFFSLFFGLGWAFIVHSFYHFFDYLGLSVAPGLFLLERCLGLGRECLVRHCVLAKVVCVQLLSILLIVLHALCHVIAKILECLVRHLLWFIHKLYRSFLLLSEACCQPFCPWVGFFSTHCREFFASVGSEAESHSHSAFLLGLACLSDAVDFLRDILITNH